MFDQKGSGLIFVILALAIIAVLAGGAYYWNSSQKSSTQVVNNQTPAPTINTSPSPSTIPFPDLSKEAIKPKFVIDTTNWKLFEDKIVGFSFRYPPEWGESIIGHPMAETGQAYLLSFKDANFVVGGSSKDFSIGRESGITDFNGFGNGLGIGDPSQLCKNPDYIQCQKDNSKANILIGAFCSAGPVGYSSVSRMMYLDRPGKKISGLVLGGDFSKYTLNELQGWFCNADYTPNKDNIDKFNAALLNRRLDADSLKNLDTFEAVFNTVKTF